MTLATVFVKRVTKNEKASMVQDMKREGNGLGRLDGKASSPTKLLSGFFSSRSRKALDLLLSGQSE